MTVVELPDVVPIFPLSGALLLPRGVLPLNIFEPRYLTMVKDALQSKKMIGVIQPLGPDATGENPPVYPHGCIGLIREYQETDDGRILIAVEGLSRFRILEELTCTTPYRQVLTSYQDFESDQNQNSFVDLNLRSRFLEALGKYLIGRGLAIDHETVADLQDEALINSLAMTCPFGPAEKQALLENISLDERANTMIALMNFALAEANTKNKTPKH